MPKRKIIQRAIKRVEETTITDSIDDLSSITPSKKRIIRRKKREKEQFRVISPRELIEMREINKIKNRKKDAEKKTSTER